MKVLQFDEFRELFLECLSGETGISQNIHGELKWLETGDLTRRQQILELINKKLKKKHGVEFQINRRLLMVEGPVESAIIQTFHELSTINIMERINAKIKARMENEKH